jgi:superfamily II DNA or RNA helicase
MPQIFDNIDKSFLPSLRETMKVSERADFCVGYFNLRGWRAVDELVGNWSGGEGHCCRLLVGMCSLPREDLRAALSLVESEVGVDNQTALKLKKSLAMEFRDQLMSGAPSNQDEAGLRRLAKQIRSKKLVVKLFLRHHLHAKLYLLFRPADPVSPLVGYMGSSNLTFAGLSMQGELNIDVLDQDAGAKLAKWFEERWSDKWCIDISKELLEVIEQSWAREDLVPPYHVYLKMAYHLSQEARSGLATFNLPTDLAGQLFEFQVAAVKIAAHHLNKRRGVLIGDVVGLGKTLMATAVARIFEDDYDLETLVICPKNLVEMWEDYRTRYRLRARVLSVSRVIKELPDLRRYRLVIIDESHNLRNREGKRFRAIQEYVRQNGSKVVLLTATPYNKTYTDLSNQLRLFIEEDRDVGIRPENLLRDIGETEFIRRHQCSVRSLPAFDKSCHPDDWRELMRLFLVRRTRGFIQENYAFTDPQNGRKYLVFPNGDRSYFPTRVPRTLKFKIDDQNPEDQYARLFSDEVVAGINALNLPRYGLGNYIEEHPEIQLSAPERKTMEDLSRAGRRLAGFCRTNLFKRLESSGYAFLLSVERHILRNFVYEFALENSLPVPVGTQDSGLLDERLSDGDQELFDSEDDGDEAASHVEEVGLGEDLRARAEAVYRSYSGAMRRQFKWLPASLFSDRLAEHLRADSSSLLRVLDQCGEWKADQDQKLKCLVGLITKKHKGQKVLVFTQFADTVDYLRAQLVAQGVQRVAGVTGDSENPTRTAWRFSPASNQRKERFPDTETLDVLVATDVLSEGQNLQDASIVVNYDLPWAIIRLIQRAGRVDRIGQNADSIQCYTFLPAEGVERIIRLRSRLRLRLKENAEVVGTDEAFFEDDRGGAALRDLFTEKAGILDGDKDTEVDLGSYAYQIWKRATDQDPTLEASIQGLSNVVFATRAHAVTKDRPPGVLAYVKTSEGNDALAWLDMAGHPVTESQYAILQAAACMPDESALPRMVKHHELVRKAVAHIAAEEKSVGGQLGRPSGARFRTYERLKRHAETVKGTLFDTPQLKRAIEDVYNLPLRQVATDLLNRQLRSGISDQELAKRVIELREEGRLSVVQEEQRPEEPQIICSLGLSGPSGGA